MFTFLTSLNPHDVLGALALIATAATFIVHRIGHVQHRVLIDDLADKLNAINSVAGPANGSGTVNP